MAFGKDLEEVREGAVRTPGERTSQAGGTASSCKVSLPALSEQQQRDQHGGVEWLGSSERGLGSDGLGVAMRLFYGFVFGIR